MFQLGDKEDVYLWISTDSDPYLRKGALLTSPPLYNMSVTFEWEMNVATANFSDKIPEKVRSNRAALADKDRPRSAEQAQNRTAWPSPRGLEPPGARWRGCCCSAIKEREF